MSTGIPRKVRPFKDGGTPPDSAHSAQSEFEFSQQTQAMAYRCSGSTMHWTWPNPGGADEAAWASTWIPKANITAADTWTEFGLGSAFFGVPRLEIPWRFTEGFGYVMAYFTLITGQSTELALRLSSETLLDAVATVNGEIGSRGIPNGPTELHSWRDLNNGTTTYRSRRYYCKLVPTVPSNRRVLLVPSIKCVDASNPQYDVSGTTNVYIENMSFQDWPEDDKGFW